MKKNRILYVLIIILYASSCSIKSRIPGPYDNLMQQKIEYRDSLLILYTVMNWAELDWQSWAIRSDLYKITLKDIEYFTGGVFYSPDKLKLLVWVGQKGPNASSLEKYSNSNPEANKLCPNNSDTVYNMSALIGIRDSINQIWKLYPFDKQSAACFRTKEALIELFARYYFKEMKNHQLYRVVQGGNRKGFKELQALGYNLQDKNFWERCWLFEKDTVGSYGLYPFQIQAYRVPFEEPYYPSCAIPFNPPSVNYPVSIIDLYR